MVADRSLVRTTTRITVGNLARWLFVDLKTVHDRVRRGQLAGRRTQGHEHAVRTAVAWLTGWADALAASSSAEHLGLSLAAQSPSRTLDRGEPSQLASGFESVR